MSEEMNPQIWRSALFAAALLAPVGAQAQTGEEDEGSFIEEDRSLAEEAFDAPERQLIEDTGEWRSAKIAHGELEFDINLQADVYTQDNADLRALDESTDDAVRFSDDRHTDAFTRFETLIRYRPVEQVELNLGVRADILWGGDLDTTTGGTDRDDYFLSNFGLRDLNVRYTPVSSDAAELSVAVGRQKFEIGGAGRRDYVLDYHLDALTTTLDLRQYGQVRVLILDLFGGSDPSDTLASVAYSSDREQFAGYGGKTNTYRSGLVYAWSAEDVFEGAASGLEASAYYFFTKFGASCQGSGQYTTGNDISYCGELGNFIDNDYIHNYGLRARYSLDYGLAEDASSFTIYGEFGRSQGIDRKEPQQFDNTTDGNMFGLGVNWSHRFNETLRLNVDWEGYHFDGAKYASNGQRFQHGYVGMRGDRVGGMLMSNILGWRPSASANNFGVENEPYDRFRIGGMAFLSVAAGLEIQDTTIGVSAYMYKDTAESLVSSFPDGTPSNLPAGYAGDEIDAQRGLGESLGTELNATVRQSVANDLLRFSVQGGVFLPGAFYDNYRPPTVTNDDLVIGGGDDVGAGERAFWALRLGMEFDL